MQGVSTLNSLAYKNDLEFLYNELLKHPLFIVDKKQLVEFRDLYDSVIDKQHGYEDFVDSLTLLTGFFHDGHTNIELPYSFEDKCLNIPCYWHDNQLLLLKEYDGIAADAEIVSIEKIPIEEAVQLMSKRIPHENTYLVKSRMINYPYKNYHIFSEMNLKYLFGDRESYKITFFVNGKIYEKFCGLQNYNGCIDFNDTDKFIHYEIKDDTVILHLDACICNEEYEATLDDVVELCNTNKYKSLILDLSNNMGGSSAVIDEFIKHINIDEFRRYEMIDYSQGEPKYITRRQDIIKNQKSSKLFDLDIKCRVSYDTFSSARTFAVTLKDNGIAKIIGGPTGGRPNSFGMPRKYRTPNNNVFFRVSSSLFLRPDMAGDNEISLFPDK